MMWLDVALALAGARRIKGALMWRRKPAPCRWALHVSVLGVGVLAGLVLPTSRASASLPYCSAPILSGFLIENVTIVSATDVPAHAQQPEYCLVQGTVATNGEGAGPGSAEFVVKLPDHWANRFVFFGCGGNCGSVKPVSANQTDVAAALGLGYAVVNTDTGHEQDPTTPDPTWNLLEPGVPNEPAIIDFFYRAVHQVTVATKVLAETYYRDRIEHAYFDGCSTGGRQAVMEGDRYPEDFDGLIAGDPIIDPGDELGAVIKQAKAFLPRAAYIPFSLLPAIDAAVNASCDATDGLIQNPAKCAFNPRSLVPGTLTAAQAEALEFYLKELFDTRGNPVAPGMPVGNYATAGFEGEAEISTPAVDPDGAEPWGGIGKGPSAWTRGDSSIRYFIEREPIYDVNNDWPQRGNSISVAAVTLVRQRTSADAADDPRKLRRFLREDRKMILYHGFSDDMASPFRSIWFYKALARQEHGYARLQRHARLFMVPGMGHCVGGSGPNSFATLTALDDWVTQGVAPDGIVAANSGSHRTMPLCKFPEEASYLGGPVDVASSWTCEPGDRRLLETGADGELSGADDAYPGGRDDQRAGERNGNDQDRP
jgi:feruloyl esterase